MMKFIIMIFIIKDDGNHHNDNYNDDNKNDYEYDNDYLIIISSSFEIVSYL